MHAYTHACMHTYIDTIYLQLLYVRQLVAVKRFRPALRARRHAQPVAEGGVERGAHARTRCLRQKRPKLCQVGGLCRR